MQEELPGPAVLVQGTADPSQRQIQRVVAELVLDSHRVVGELHYGGGHRRLVDILNAVDEAFVVLHNGVVDHFRFHRAEEEPRGFQVMHVRLQAILLAIPRAGVPPQGDRFEVVAKVPVPATIVLPGVEVTGKLYLPPDADPAQIRLLGGKQFIPLTDTMVVPVEDRSQARPEPLLVVNLARALVYAPGGLTGPRGRPASPGPETAARPPGPERGTSARRRRSGSAGTPQRRPR